MNENVLDLNLKELIEFVRKEYKKLFGENCIPNDKEIAQTVRFENSKFSFEVIYTELENQRLMNNFNFWLNTHYNLTIDDVIPNEMVKGYWKMKNPCGGLKGGCKHPIHGLLFCDESINHTLSYFDNLRGKDGKFQSIYKTWNLHLKLLN